MLELVRSRSTEGSLELLVWDGRQSRVVNEFQFRGRKYVPATLTPGVLQAIRFPNAAVGYKSASDLCQAMLEVTAKYSGLLTRELRLIPYFALASWFPELLSTPPMLVISGPSPAEARRLLRLLRCFCRHGVVVSELTAGGFWTIPMQLRPTLLIDIARLTGQMRALLRASSTRGTYVARGGAFMDFRSVKAVYSVESDIDSKVSEALLRVSAPPTDGRALLLNEREEGKIANEFQPKLLRYRLENYQAVQASTFDAPTFATGVRELAVSLGAAVIGDAKLQEDIVALLARQDDELRARRRTLPECGIVTAMLSLLHEGRKSDVHVSDFAKFVNAALRAEGELRVYSAEEIGHRLASMGISRSRTGRGMVIKLTRDVSKLSHDLGSRYGVKTIRSSFPRCPDCKPLGCLTKKEV